ncbi:MAG: hypothetical protein Q9M24_00530 [Mariprofundaceae bacterium]|nr:hypothetical protein [Mariprofundaceae bacterium]
MSAMVSAVLIMDDDIREAETLRRRLGSRGIRAFIASSGEAASKLLAAYPFVLNILKPARWNRMPAHPLQAYIHHNIPKYKVMVFESDLSVGECLC